jgi:EAL domain-containing protein (putative c-di-GMP-specific phosphodiesterase class I)
VLLEPMEQEEDAGEMAQRIIDALDDPVRIAGKELYSSTSIGIAYAQPHYRTPEELLRDADVALYRAKAKGRRRFELFDETLRQEALAQLEMEGALRRAILRGEFEPHFQPIIDLRSGATVGFEALLRWRRPQGGLLAPGDFLVLAEDSGLAEAIDWQVFELAFAQAHALLAHGGFISINVGGRHFRSSTFVAELMQLMQRYELPPAQLRIEVTERTLLEDPDEVRRMMAELDAAGVSLALDDFGTGYSSLSYLHQFPLHAIKIDRSFVSALVPQVTGSAAAVLRAICSLGHSLGMELIAEGIETEEQRCALMEMGCDFGQGFLLALPASAASLVAAAGAKRNAVA